VEQLGVPSTHALLWLTWRVGTGGVWDLFRGWLLGGVAFEDAGATDVLSMDLQWRRDSREGELLSMVEHAVPIGAVRGAVEKASGGRPLPHFVRFRADVSTRAEQGGSGPGPGIASPESRLRWSQRGSPSHWQRVASLIECVDAKAEQPPS